MYLVYTEAQWLILVMECNIMRRGREDGWKEQKQSGRMYLSSVNTGILLKLNSERKHFSFSLIRDEKWLFDHVCVCVCVQEKETVCTKCLW